MHRKRQENVGSGILDLVNFLDPDGVSVWF